MAPIWALIVGISTYEHPDYEDISGAHVDVEETSRYLLDDMGVPETNIVELENEKATRENIINAFQHHLIKNDKIQDGDAILFHFSGHGSQSEAPERWPVIDKKDGESGKLEMIIPYDESTLDDDKNPICGIPDRTLAALLSTITKRHGENVTVVLDCCHSGHGTRSEGSPYTVRGIDPDKVTPLRSDVDKDIWGSVQGSGTIGERRGGFTIQRAKTHVLIAACGQKEVAMGSTEGGGILTSLWLKALRDKSIQPRSYSQLMKVVTRGVEDIRKEYPQDVKQHPQCEGITRDRLVFQSTRLDLQFFEVKKERGNTCRITAGGVHGVKVGTTFEIYEVNPHSTKVGRTLGTAVANYVDSTYCLADVANSVWFTGQFHSARILGQVNPLQYAVINTEPNSPDALSTLQKIEQGLSTMSPEIAYVVQRVQDPDKADLILEVDGRGGGGVTLQRRDTILRDLNTRSPRLDTRDIHDADFANLLNSIARFNTYLSQSSEAHPFSEHVELEFHLLQEDPNLDFLSDDVLTEARGLKQEILPKNDELEIQQVDSDDYAFILRSSSSKPLYVYVVYFDTGTYEISLWYSPANPDQATLLPKGVLQIGASPEHAEPFSFFVRRGDDVDTSFVKIFILDSPTQMLFMEQKPQIGLDENGRRFLRFKRANDTEPGVRTPPRKGGWDCLTRKIIVRRPS